jgi:mono/diheme cytochrome c family protein
MRRTTISRALELRAAVAFFVIASAGCHGKYIRAIDDAPIERTPERLQRGGYLVNQVMSCGGCHTSRATGNILVEPERADAFLGGGNHFPGKGLGKLWIPNLTPDVETGLGAWKDDEILRALRDGVSRDGHFLLPMMPFDEFQHLSDEDARSIVAYLRSIPAVKEPRARPENEIGFMPKVLFKVIGVQMHAPATNVAAPAPSDKVAFGKYLARIGGCTSCHSMTDKGPRKETDELFMSGADVGFEDPSLGTVYPRNLTSDAATGLGNYDAAAIKQAIRTGHRLDGKSMAPPMSILIPHISGLTDEDLDALVAYLKSLPAVKHQIPARNLAPALRAPLGD